MKIHNQNLFGVLSNSDLEENIYLNQELLEKRFEGISSKAELENCLLEINDMLYQDKQYMIEKYQNKYLELLRKYKSDEIVNSDEFDIEKKYYSDYQKEYIKEISEVLKRNPEYKKGIPNEKIIEIASEFDILPERFYRVMFKRDTSTTLYTRDYSLLQRREKIKLPNKFLEIMYKDIEDTCKSISGKITSNNNLSFSDREELQSMLKLALIEYGGNVVFNAKDRNLDDIISMLGGYAKRIGNASVPELLKAKSELIIDKDGKDSDEIAEDHDKYLMDKKVNVEEQAINNVTNEKREVVSRCSELADFDLEMLELLVDDNHVEMLENFAKKLGIEKDKLKDTIDKEIEFMRE